VVHRDVRGDEVATAWQRVKQGGDDRRGLVVVLDEMQGGQHDQRGRLAEVKHPAWAARYLTARPRNARFSRAEMRMAGLVCRIFSAVSRSAAK
jgi:hypothetical protein